VTEERSLKEEMARLSATFEEMVQKKETKRFRMPFKGWMGRKKVRDGWAIILYINENRSLKFMKAPIKEGTVMIDGAPFLATTDYMLNYKNKPVIIIPSWNVEPFSPQNNLDEATQKAKLNVGYRMLLNRLKSEQIKPKASISIGMIIILLAVIGGAIWYFTKGGGI